MLIDSMGGVGISSTPSLHQSSDLEKTQAELRQTFSAAENFRRELEYLQKGGDPLDLKPGNVASISFQSTSPTDRHPEQFVTSEAKGSFAITASPHGDSIESSCRLGAPSVCEPNSADNLLLFDGDIKFHEVEKRPVHPHANNTKVGNITKESGDSVVLELPKKSYKRRIRSRPNRDGPRSSSTDAVPSRGGHFLPFRHAATRDYKGLAHDADNQDPNYLNSNSSRLENKLDGVLAVQSTLAVLDANALQNTQENHLGQPIKSDGQETPVSMASTEPESLRDTEISEDLLLPGPTNGFGNTEEIKTRHDDSNTIAANPTKVLDSESSCSQTSQRFDGYIGNGLSTSAKQNLVSDVEGNPSCNEDGAAVKEEEALKGSESSLQNELKNSVSTEIKPNNILGAQGSNGTPSEQNACSEKNLKLKNKEREDSILKEARIIEAKRKRIAELSVRTLPPERRIKSQWDFVLEEMSWLANDFAQERLWKLTAATQISRRVAYTSRVKFQQQSSLQKQKDVAHTLAEAVMQFWHMTQVKCEEPELHCLKKDHAIGIQRYAMRFLEYNSSQAQYIATRASADSDSISDLGIMDFSWKDNLTEENLFYTVPSGAIEAYRKSIESHLLQFEKTGCSMLEEVDTSGYDAIADNAFEEEEGETNTYYLPGVLEGSKSTNTAQKRRKNFKIYGARSYETGGVGDMSFMQSVGTQPSVLSGKRPASSLNVSIPTKRVRTASRQRIISPFNAGTSGCIPAPNRTDASSGDTNSFQDEQMEAESVGDYEKQLQFDSMEVSNRPKKKKKAKHSGATFEHRWQLDSNFQNDQKDHLRRRLETHQFDSNGISAASHMSNMSNPKKIMKLLVRDRGRKAKALKTHVGQPGSGSPWSLFEDQALVVLVHDMGPNWELISDAINSTLQFKCIFRKSKECKERHKILMDRNTGDGADSAEDSGSSQPYPSTLPGIPEGSARQLFQRLQGPMEEDTLKSHFEKIIMIGQKQHYRRTQNDNQDPKQLQQPHSSHAFAFSQVCPNNLNGGPVLTPLELSESISSSPDVLPVGYQVPSVMNHGSVTPMLPGSSSTSSAPSSSNSVHASNLPSASPSVREGRHGVPRTGSLSVDDQQRIQQYNQMLSARNTHQSSMPPGSHPVGVRMLPAGSGMSVMSGMNRGMRPGFPGMLNSGSMLSSGMATPSSVAGPAQGNSLSRPRDPMNTIRPNQNADRQKIAPADLQTQHSSQCANQVSQPPVQSYPLHQRSISPQQSPRMLGGNSHRFQGPPNHATNTQHPAYGMRFANERQLQQQRLLQHQQFPTSNAMMPHVQPQDSMQSRSSISPMGTPSMAPMPQLPQKHPAPAPPHGLLRNPQTSGNQMVKQRQSQQFQQVPPQQQAKLMKGGSGRGTMMMLTDPLLSNGFSGGQSSADKGGHGNLYSGSSGNQSAPSSSSTHTGHIQAVSSKQHQQQKPSNSPDHRVASGTPSLMASSNQKLVSQKQATNSQKVLNNRKVNPSDLPTSKLQAQAESPMSPNQPNTTVLIPHASSNDANSNGTPGVSMAAALQRKTSDTIYDSSGAVSDNAATHRQSSSDSLPNPVGHDAGVQWQQEPPS